MYINDYKLEELKRNLSSKVGVLAFQGKDQGWAAAQENP